jgi:uncharacterized RDD family membrane protein YckC
MPQHMVTPPIYYTSYQQTVQQQPKFSTPSFTPNTQVSGRRLLALILDSLVLTAVQWILGMGLWGSSVQQVPLDTNHSFWITVTHQLNWPWMLVIAFAYFLIFEAIFGASIGKLLVGLRVVTLSGQHPKLWQTCVRSALRVLEVSPALQPTAWIIAALFIAFTSRHQRIGDLLARTVVAERASVQPTALSSQQRLRRGAFALALAELVAVLCLGFTFYIQPYQYAHDWRAGQSPDFIHRYQNSYGPDEIGNRMTLVNGPLRSQNAQGEETVTYIFTFQTMIQTYNQSSGLFDEKTQRYNMTVTYHWTGVFSGWEIEPTSVLATLTD